MSVIKKPYTMSNGKITKLSKEEVLALHYLYKQRFLKTTHMHQYLKSLNGDSIKYESYRVKVFEKYIPGKIVKSFQRVDGISRYNYYKIWTCGMEILLKEGLITQEEFDKQRFRHWQLKTQQTHYFYIQDLVLSAVNFANDMDIPVEFSHASENVYRIDGEVIPLKPDWVIKTPSITVNLEVDKSTELRATIKKKVVEYGRIAKQNPEQNFAVLFSISPKVQEDKTGRTWNIKDDIMAMDEATYDNLTVYVTKPDRAKVVLNKIVSGDYPTSPMLEAMAADDIIKVCRSIPGIESMTYKPVQQYYSQNTPHKLLPKAIYEVSKGDMVPFSLAIVNMDEGNVSQLKRLIQFGELVSNPHSSPIKKVIGVYTEEEALHEDILGIKLDNLAVTTTEDGSASLYVPKTLYRMEVIKHEKFFN